MLKTGQFDYSLPLERIAQHPLDSRDASRLMVLNRSGGHTEHRHFKDLTDYLEPGDILVANNSRVIAARIYGHKVSTGGKIELLLLEQVDDLQWLTLVGGKRIRVGTKIRINDVQGRPTGITATVTQLADGPQRVIAFSQPIDPEDNLGHTPLPPYIHEALEDARRYQTVYSKPPGSAAAPTAGLHFTPELLLALRSSGILFETVTLHVGLDTFSPVRSEYVVEHNIHSEWARLSQEAARRINETKLQGGRVIAVGTTTVRVLESAALRSAGVSGSFSDISQKDMTGDTTTLCPWRPVAAFEDRTDLFIYPGYRFRVVDMLLTNFHLPQSSLLMLVSAFAGREKVLSSYQEAIEKKYRFYSFGDAMLLI